MDQIQFDARSHRYFCNGTELKSVSSVVKEFVPPFDRERISKMVAAKENKTQEEVLAAWDAKRVKSIELGSVVHSHIEDSLSGRLDKFLLSVNPRIPEVIAFDSAWEAMSQKLGARVIDKECIVWDAMVGVAGRIDAIVNIQESSASRPVACVVDWKTGGFKTSNRFEKLTGPFSDQDNCEYTRYSIQISLYRMLLESSRKDIQCGDGYIVHLKSDSTYQIHRAIDYRSRLSDWLSSGVTNA